MTLVKSNQLALKQYEKPIIKDYNYFMIISRNKTLNSVKQYSVLKTLLKLRDYIARLEDESPQYVIPNHVMFQMGKDMPATRLELADSIRANMSGLLLKYQELILETIQKKLNTTKQKNQHVKFDNKTPVEGAKHENTGGIVKISQEIAIKSQEDTAFSFVERKYPEYNIKLVKHTAVSQIFENAESKQVGVMRKTKVESKVKALEDKMVKHTWNEQFQALTNCPHLQVNEAK